MDRLQGNPLNVLDQADIDRIISDNSVEEFPKLRGAPGYCLDTMPWNQIVELIRENTTRSLGTLGRHPSGIVTYRRFRQQVLDEYASMTDFVKITILEHASTAGPAGKKITMEASKPREGPMWRVNDFPYNFEEGVEHHNVWSSTPLTDVELRQVIEANRVGWDFAYFVNPPPLASIPTVWHAHVVSRRKA